MVLESDGDGGEVNMKKVLQNLFYESVDHYSIRLRLSMVKNP